MKKKYFTISIKVKKACFKKSKIYTATGYGELIERNSCMPNWYNPQNRIKFTTIIRKIKLLLEIKYSKSYFL